jgi:hypothetical protein
MEAHHTCDFAKFFNEDPEVAPLRSMDDEYNGMINHLGQLAISANPHFLANRRTAAVLTGTYVLLPEKHQKYKVAMIFCLMKVFPAVLEDYYFTSRCKAPVPTYRQAVLRKTIDVMVERFCRMGATPEQVYTAVKAALFDGVAPS